MSDTKIGAWGISYGGGQVWNGLAAGIPYKAAEVVETWTDLYGALWPQDIARSGIVAGFANAVAARSPLITQYQTDAIQSLNAPAIKPLTAPRSVLTHLATITPPVSMFQRRANYRAGHLQLHHAIVVGQDRKYIALGQDTRLNSGVSAQRTAVGQRHIRPRTLPKSVGDKITHVGFLCTDVLALHIQFNLGMPDSLFQTLQQRSVLLIEGSEGGIVFDLVGYWNDLPVDAFEFAG